MNKTAIVIDDDYDTVDTFSELLEEQQITVIGKGYNGKNAIDLYSKHSPDVVFNSNNSSLNFEKSTIDCFIEYPYFLNNFILSFC